MRRLSSVVVPALVALPLLTGCPAGISGDLDGQDLPTFYSALFTQQDTKLGADDAFQVGAGGISVINGCDGATKRQENFNEAFDTFIGDIDGETDPDRILSAQGDFVDAQVEYDQKNLPSDYWTVSVGVVAKDDGDIDGAESDIDIKDPDTNQDVFASLSICRVNDFPEADTDANDSPFVKADQDCWGAIQATVTVNKYEKDSAFEIVAEATVGEIDPDTGLDPEKDVGDVTVTINAGYCESLEKALEDTADLNKDLQDVLNGG